MDTSRLSVATTALSGRLRMALRQARELGVRGVEIDARAGVDPTQLSHSGVRQLRKWLDDEGLVVSAVAFRTRGGYADVERLEPRIAATKAAMQLAQSLGAGVVLNHLGDIPPEPVAAEAGRAVEPGSDPRWRLLVDVLSDLGAWGQRVGATLCAEAGRAAPGDLLRVMAALPEGSLTCDVVTGALVVHGYDPVSAVETLSRHVGFVHATDAVAGAFAGRGRAVILGTGQVDLAGVLGALEERSFRGWIGLEPVDDRGGGRELAGAVDYVRAL